MKRQALSAIIALPLVAAGLLVLPSCKPAPSAPPATPAATPASKPVASPVARHEAQDSNIVTNLWHERVHLTSIGQPLLRLLDGTSDQAMLIDQLTQQAAAGKFQVAQNEKAITDAGQLRELFNAQVGPTLRSLARAGMLVG